MRVSEFHDLVNLGVVFHYNCCEILYIHTFLRILLEVELLFRILAPTAASEPVQPTAVDEHTRRRSTGVVAYLSEQIADLLVVNFNERSADEKLLVRRDRNVVEDVHKGVRDDT